MDSCNKVKEEFEYKGNMNGTSLTIRIYNKPKSHKTSRIIRKGVEIYIRI